MTPSLGVELPNLVFYEPCFARSVEWTLLEALRGCADRQDGFSTYLRLSTKPIDQSNVMLFNPATGKGDRVGFKFLEDGKKVRIYKSNGEQVKSPS